MFWTCPNTFHLHYHHLSQVHHYLSWDSLTRLLISTIDPSSKFTIQLSRVIVQTFKWAHICPVLWQYTITLRKKCELPTLAAYNPSSTPPSKDYMALGTSPTSFPLLFPPCSLSSSHTNFPQTRHAFFLLRAGLLAVPEPSSGWHHLLGNFSLLILLNHFSRVWLCATP